MTRRNRGREAAGGIAPVYEGPEVLAALLERAGSPFDVDEVAARYQRVGRASASELEHLTRELKGAWSHISRQLK